MGISLSVSSAAIAPGESPPAAAFAVAEACDPWSDSPAVRAWERNSSSADTLAYFQTAGWARAAGDYDKAIGRTPVLLTGHQPGGASFWLPLSIGRERGCRVARILGEQMAEYANVVGESVTPEGLREALAWLRQRCRVDLVALRRVPQGNRLDDTLNELGAITESPQEAPWVPLGPEGPLPNPNGGRFTGYKQACRHRRRLQKENRFQFDVFEAEEAPEDLLRLALSWKKQWIRERRLVSRVGTDPLDDAMCALFTTPGIGAAVGVLLSDGEPVAVETGFRFRERFYGSMRAYRPDHREQRVGKIALCEMVEWCARQGLAAFDHGPPADAYKLEWTDSMLPVANRLVPLSFLGRLHGQAFEGRFKPAARAAFGSLPAPLRAALLRLTRYAH